MKLIIKDDFLFFRNLFKYCKEKNNITFLKNAVRYNKTNFVKFLLKFIKNYDDIEVDTIEQIMINGDINILNNFKKYPLS